MEFNRKRVGKAGEHKIVGYKRQRDRFLGKYKQPELLIIKYHILFISDFITEISTAIACAVE